MDTDSGDNNVVLLYPNPKLTMPNRD